MGQSIRYLHTSRQAMTWQEGRVVQCSVFSLNSVYVWTLVRPNLAAPELKRLVAGFPPRRPGFNPRSGHVGFVVDKVALGQVFSEYFGFPYQSFHQLLYKHHLSSGAGTIGQQWPTYQVDSLSVSPHPGKLKKKKKDQTCSDVRTDIHLSGAVPIQDVMK
jgi:hypothetical protein